MNKNIIFAGFGGQGVLTLGQTIALIAMNEPSLRKFENEVKEGGIILIESSIIKTDTTRKDVKVYHIDATDIASKLGNLKVVNVVMLGAFAKVVGDFTIDEAFETLKEKLHGKEKF